MGAQAVRLSNIDIDKALEQRHFELLFQPIFDLSNGALARIETFVRWRHETLGLLPPGAFISFFETQGRMSELTRYVLEQTLESYLAWRGPYQPGFSINLALSDLTDESFVSHFTVLLREKNFPAELVTLECPMPPVTMERSTAIASFERLAGTGARLAIEIRGRANDFVRTLEPFPFAEIKTGGAAILRFARTVRGPGLSAISELLDLAKERNAAITAVGVEDQASLTALRGLNFDAAQGNHLGRVGLLKDFKLSMVNDVRSNLELDVLSKNELDDMFRTHIPETANAEEPKTNRKESKTAKKATKTKRPKRKQIKQPTQAITPETEDTPPSEEDLLDRLEERLSTKGNHFKAIEEDRKAAAIRRARMKKTALDTNDKAATSNEAQQPSPHELQERLTQEFSEQDDKPELEKTESNPIDAEPKDTPAEIVEPSDKTDANKVHADANTPESNATAAEEPVASVEMADKTDTEETVPALSSPSQSLSNQIAASQEKASAMKEESNDEPNETTAIAKEPDAKSTDTNDAESAGDTPELESIQRGEAPKTKPTQRKMPSLIDSGGISVKNAHAFFRPGVKVASPESLSIDELYADFYKSEEAEKAARAQDLNQQSDATVRTAETNEQEELTEDEVVVDFKDAAPTSDFESEVNDEIAQEQPLASPLVEQDFIAAVQSIDDHEKQRARTRGNFLTRKHRLFSGYFWPRAWRHSWAKKEAEKLAAETASFDS